MYGIDFNGGQKKTVKISAKIGVIDYASFEVPYIM